MKRPFAGIMIFLLLPAFLAIPIHDVRGDFNEMTEMIIKDSYVSFHQYPLVLNGDFFHYNLTIYDNLFGMSVFGVNNSSSRDFRFRVNTVQDDQGDPWWSGTWLLDVDATIDGIPLINDSMIERLVRFFTIPTREDGLSNFISTMDAMAISNNLSFSSSGTFYTYVSLLSVRTKIITMDVGGTGVLENVTISTSYIEESGLALTINVRKGSTLLARFNIKYGGMTSSTRTLVEGIPSTFDLSLSWGLNATIISGKNRTVQLGRNVVITINGQQVSQFECEIFKTYQLGSYDNFPDNGLYFNGNVTIFLEEFERDPEKAVVFKSFAPASDWHLVPFEYDPILNAVNFTISDTGQIFIIDMPSYVEAFSGHSTMNIIVGVAAVGIIVMFFIVAAKLRRGKLL